MTSEDVDAEFQPLVKTYQDKIEMLSNLINKLEDTKRDLDTRIAVHQANALDVKAGETQLFELIKEIELKKNLAIQTTETMNELTGQKVMLQGEIDTLNTEVEAKKQYLSDIDKLQSDIVLLQEEMAEFQDKYTENKKMAQAELDTIRQNLIDLGEKIKTIIS